MSNEVEEWKKRALEAEHEREEARNEAASAYIAGRADTSEAMERAEAEVERLRRQRDEDAEKVRKAIDERTAAEADNAALRLRLDACRDVMEQHGWDDYDPTDTERIAYEGCFQPADAPIPSAALLAEVEVLRRFYDAARPFAEATGAKDANVVTDEEWALVYAHAAVDALKGKS